MTLDWVPRGLRLELEVAARPVGDGRLVPVRSRGGGVPAQRGWLCAVADTPLLSDEMLGRDAEWLLKAGRRRWATIAKRVRAPEDEAERLARAGIIEIECRLTDTLRLDGYAGWRLTGEAAKVAESRAGAHRSLRTDLERELRDEDLVECLRNGLPRPGMSWLDYVRVLRAAELWLALVLIAHDLLAWTQRLALTGGGCRDGCQPHSGAPPRYRYAGAAHSQSGQCFTSNSPYGDRR